VVAGVLLAAVLTAAFPADPLTAGSDQSTYASHALYIANHGGQDVPNPWPSTEAPPPGFDGYPGVYFTQPTLTVQFAHLYPAWLAQTYETAGYGALERLNVLLGLLALVAVYGLMTRYMRRGIAAVSVLFIAFNPAQIWVVRQTLTEVPTQLLVWCGLLLLVTYLASGRRLLGLWAGVLLAASAFVRIDAFLLLPFLLLGHALWNVTDIGRSRSRTWLPVYAGALPLFAIALLLYFLFSRPYLDDLRTPMLQIGALVVVGAASLVGTYIGPVNSFVRSLIARRGLVFAFLGLVAVATAYAYFIRPILPPFDVINAPGKPFDGQRSYVEDALANAGRYLTPGVIWVGVLGWSIALFGLTRGKRWAAHAAPILMVVIGITAVYTWNQSVFPTHFWAIRRFVPEIIPGLVLFSGIGVMWFLGRLSIKGRRLTVALVVPMLALWTVYIGAPMYVTPEREGSFAGLTQFAQSVPSQPSLYALDGDYESLHYWMPLLLGFDQPIIPLDSNNDVARAEAIRRLSAASPADPVTVVTGAYDFRMDSLVGTRIANVAWSSPVMVETTNPVPHDVTTQSNDLTAISVTGLNTVGVPFGGSPQWIAPGTGFHPAQLVDGRPLRWTDGDGKLAIPIEGGQTPGRLRISIADTGPNGGPLRITLNGEVLFDEVVAAGPWSSEYDITALDLQPAATANLEITSNTFQSSPVDEADRETSFGVQVDQVVLTGQ
jgi:hypothetical protein